MSSINPPDEEREGGPGPRAKETAAPERPVIPWAPRVHFPPEIYGSTDEEREGGPGPRAKETAAPERPVIPWAPRVHFPPEIYGSTDEFVWPKGAVYTVLVLVVAFSIGVLLLQIIEQADIAHWSSIILGPFAMLMLLWVLWRTIKLPYRRRRFVLRFVLLLFTLSAVFVQVCFELLMERTAQTKVYSAVVLAALALLQLIVELLSG